MRFEESVFLTFVAFFPSVLWYCWLGLLTCNNCLPDNLYCVGGDVKPCWINQLRNAALTREEIELIHSVVKSSCVLSCDSRPVPLIRWMLRSSVWSETGITAVTCSSVYTRPTEASSSGQQSFQCICDFLLFFCLMGFFWLTLYWLLLFVVIDQMTRNMSPTVCEMLPAVLKGVQLAGVQWIFRCWHSYGSRDLSLGVETSRD